jgi:hypothetical protein
MPTNPEEIFHQGSELLMPLFAEHEFVFELSSRGEAAVDGSRPHSLEEVIEGLSFTFDSAWDWSATISAPSQFRTKNTCVLSWESLT